MALGVTGGPRQIRCDKSGKRVRGQIRKGFQRQKQMFVFVSRSNREPLEFIEYRSDMVNQRINVLPNYIWVSSLIVSAFPGPGKLPYGPD